ncbi:MAG TPA: SLBB domain-containing protein [Candidatus Sulfotelmatobacter sp.]|nr:SLBB domain-containing protein [Candidatus Sulfotelmatobacter sp.]
MNTRIIFLALSLFLLCAGASRAQEPDNPADDEQTGDSTRSQQQSTTQPQGAPDCLVHPEAQACPQPARPSPDARSQNPNKEQLPSNLSTPYGPEPSVERGRRATNQIPLPQEPPPPPTEFQLMVADSVGKLLPIYGASLFRSAPTTFAPLENVPVPADYAVGPGDELFVRVWGPINAELRVTVDRNGQVFVPKVGSITAAGVRVSNLDTQFRSQIERIYKNFELSVTLGKLRSINVFFVGQVRRPGTYTISSLSTLVNAIFAAGGPAPQGSMRHIQLKRDGQVITEIDLYDLLLKGDKSGDVALLPGDVIYVPPAGPQVAVSGSVNTPSIYELKDGHTTLAGVIELAGGLSTVADGTSATIERIDRRQVRSVAEFPLDSQGQQEMVKDGDIVRILSVVPRFDNAVTLRGNVANPGRYPWHVGMKIHDLLPDKEMLLTRGYWQSQNALVVGAMTQYQRYDNQDKPGNSERINVPQAQRSETQEMPGTSPHVPESRAGEGRLRTDVKLNAPEINWDYAVIQRLNPVDLSTTLLPFSLGKVVLEGDPASNLELQPGDVITIFSQHDISVPVKRQTMFVRVEGEVRVPGIYHIEQGETLRDLLKRAGGFTENAYVYGMQFTRESARREQQASLDRVASTVEAEINEKAIANTRSNPENAAAIAAQTESQRGLLQQLRLAKATGRIVLQLKPGDTTIAAVPPVTLEDLDRVIVPPRSQVVSVVGAVFNQSSFLYRKGATVGDYIHAAGNGNATADLQRALLVRADGSVVGHTSVFRRFGESFESMHTLPGDAIVVPVKLQSGGVSKAMRDWMLVASQAAIAAAVIAVH